MSNQSFIKNSHTPVKLMLASAVLLAVSLQPASAAIKSAELKVLVNKVQQSADMPDCESRSPRFEKLGDDYFGLEPMIDASSSKDEQIVQKKLQAIHKKLQGRWSGATIQSTCWKDNGQLVKRTKHFELAKVKSELDYKNRLVWKGDRKELQLRNGNAKVLSRGLLEDTFLRADELQDIDMSNPNEIIVNYRHRFSGGNSRPAGSQSLLVGGGTIGGGGFSQMREHHITMILEGKTLTINTDWYNAGHYTGTATTFLKRTR